MKFFVGNALWHLFVQSDAMTAGIMFGFLVASILCWTLIFYKWTSIARKRSLVGQASKEMYTAHTFEQLLAVSYAYGTSLVGKLITDQLNLVRMTLKNEKSKKKLTEQDMQILEGHRLSLIEDMMHQEESSLWILSLCAAVGPLVGLFGTVWGLMHAFINISEKQIADIVTMAPGIAEALLTTLGGLLVAIHALVMFHYLQGEIREIEHRLYQVSDRLDGIVRATFVDIEVETKVETSGEIRGQHEDAIKPLARETETIGS